MRAPRIVNVLAPTHGLRDFRKTVRPDVAAQKVRSRVDWIRFGRKIELQPRDGLTRLGNAYGGYVVPLDLIDSDWICYSGGLGEDISFELELIEATGCRVFGFDPIPRAAAYVKRAAAENPRLEFRQVGLWSGDTTARFYAPTDSDHVSHSIANLQRTGAYIEAPCRSLVSLMKEFGHEHIDLLKLDVEGAEYEVLEPVFDGQLVVRVLCIDFHKVRSLDHMASAVRQLAEVGYAPVHVHRTDVTLVRDAES
jgi:FkbM family methyltransferase